MWISGHTAAADAARVAAHDEQGVAAANRDGRQLRGEVIALQARGRQTDVDGPGHSPGNRVVEDPAFTHLLMLLLHSLTPHPSRDRWQKWRVDNSGLPRWWLDVWLQPIGKLNGVGLSAHAWLGNPRLYTSF